MNRIKFLLMCGLTIFSFLLCFSQEKKQTQEKDDEKINMSQNKDIQFFFEPICREQITIGLRLEVVNCTKEDMVIVVRDKHSSMFNVQLFDQNGQELSPKAQKKSTNKRNIELPSDYQLITIPPEKGYVWFLELPDQVLIDTSKGNTDNLQPIPNGKYKLFLTAGIQYFLQHPDDKTIPQYPNYKYIKHAFPELSINVDSKLLNKDIEQTYIDSQKKK